MTGELAAVREVWAGRSGARHRSDTLYLLYLAALSLLVLGVPALRAAGELLARPDVLPALVHPLAPRLTGLALLVGAAGMVLVGAVRGPALLAPFLVSTLAASGLRRRTVLWRPFLRALLVPVLVTAVITALVVITLLSAGLGAGTAAALRTVLAAIGAGLLLGAAWLAGELLAAGPRRLLAAGLLVAGVIAALRPGGEGLAATSPGAAMLLSGVGAAATGAGVVLLDRLRGGVLLEQSRRWDSVALVATSGDLAGAAGSLRPPPSVGRRLRAVGPRPLVLLYARRDVVAWLRSPERLALGVMTALTAGAALAGSTLLTGPLGVAAVLLGAAALWGAGGALVDGIRHGVHTLGAPGLFGQRAAAQVLLHAVAPGIALTALAALGGAVVPAVADGAGAAGPLPGVLLPTLLAPVLIAGRVRDAAKGPMPLRLMTPMPTPQGDGAVLAMLFWQSDALLLALLSGVLLAGLGMLGIPWMLGGAAILMVLMMLMARQRLRALGR